MSDDVKVDHVFDRVVQFDPRSRGFAAVTLIPHNLIRSYTWKCEAWHDQGREGACVGFAWSHELTARPAKVTTTAADAMKIYKEAQKIDEWPGENYEGTSILAGVKIVRSQFKNKKGNPLIGEYRWAFGIEDLVRVLGFRGPAVLGLNWYSGMLHTNRQGFISKAGYLAGGHAILAYAVKIVWKDKKGSKEWSNVDMDSSYVTLRNSWGKLWGVNGDAKITLRDLDVLLHEQGEACVPTIRNY